MKKIISFMLAAIMLIVTIPLGAVSLNAATTTAAAVINNAISRLGQEETPGMCLAFVNKCFTACGCSSSTACCAYVYGYGHIISSSMNNIPLGAVVLFSGGSTKDDCGNYAGHAGLYIGDGYMIHTCRTNGGPTKVTKSTVQSVANWSGYSYMGWRWHGNDSFEIPAHTHDLNGGYAFREAAHPHYACYYCSVCGEAQRDTNQPGYSESCSECTNSGGTNFSPTAGIDYRISQIVEDLKTRFSNSIFTSDGTTGHEETGNYGKCSLYGIVQSKYPELSSTIASKSSNGWDCAAFAKLFTVLLFGTCKDTVDTTKGAANSSSSYNTLRKGDLIYTDHPHWMIYISHDANGVTVIDANGYGDQKIAYYRTYSYSNGNLSGSLYAWQSPHWNEVNDQYGSSTAVNPGKPVLKNLNKTYKNTDKVTFEWDTTANTTHYNLYIRTVTSEADTDYTNVYETIHYAENGLQRSLPVGKYRVLLQSTNKNATGADGTGWANTDGDWIYLEVVPSYDVLDSITINTLPDRTTYIHDEPFSGKGLTVKLNYVGGAERIISDGFTVTGFDSSTEGTKTVAVRYGDLAATFDVEVVDSEDWSGWFPAESLPDEVKNATWGYEIEHKDGYLTREREIKISGKQNEDGWTLYDTKTSSLTASDYATTKPSTTPVVKDDRVETKSYKTYYYYYLYGYEKNGDPTYMAEKTKADLINNHSLSSYDKSKLRYIYVYSEASHGETWPQYSGAAYYTDDNGKSGTINVNNGNVHFYYGGERYKVTTTATQYYHYKWSEWDNLCETEPTSSDNVEVSVAENAFVRFRKTNEPQPAVITGIAVADAQYKTEYLVGEELDLTNVSLNVYYSDGTSAVVTSGYAVSGFDSSVCGKQTVTVTYEGFTSTFEVTVYEAASDGTATIENSAAKPGEDVTVKVILDNAPEIKSMAISDVTFNLETLALLGGEWNVDNSVLSSWDESKGKGVVTMKSAEDLNGNVVFTLTFHVDDAADEGFYSISLKVSAKDKNNAAISIVTVTGGVTVRNYIVGDFNGDGEITDEDAIYLLYHTFFADEFPLNQNGDLNGDGAVTDDDAIYLLYYTFFPDEFPLC